MLKAAVSGLRKLPAASTPVVRAAAAAAALLVAMPAHANSALTSTGTHVLTPVAQSSTTLTFDVSGAFSNDGFGFETITGIGGGPVGAFLTSFGDLGIVSYSAADWTMTAVPEPGTWALMALGLAGLGLARRRR